MKKPVPEQLQVAAKVVSTYVDEALLDTESDVYKKMAGAIKNQVLYYWVGDPKPIDVLVTFTAQTAEDVRRKRAAAVNEEAVDQLVSEMPLVSEIKLVFESDVPADEAESMLRDTHGY